MFASNVTDQLQGEEADFPTVVAPKSPFNKAAWCMYDQTSSSLVIFINVYELQNSVV